MRRVRRVAAHHLLKDSQTVSGLCVVEVQDGLVMNWFPLTHEIEHTEWLGGDIVLKRDNNGGLRAFHNDIMIE